VTQPKRSHPKLPPNHRTVILLPAGLPGPPRSDDRALRVEPARIPKDAGPGIGGRGSDEFHAPPHRARPISPQSLLFARSGRSVVGRKRVGRALIPLG